MSRQTAATSKFGAVCDTAGMEPQRIVVVSGHPEDMELAALTAALHRHQPEDEPAPAPPASRWARAARLESCGRPPIDSPARLAWEDGAR